MKYSGFAKATQKRFPGHKDRVCSVSFNSDGRKLGSGSMDETIRIHHVEEPKSFPLKGHKNHVDQISWAPNHPERLVSCSSDRTVRFWDIRSRITTLVIETEAENIHLDWSANEHMVAVGDTSDTISFIDPRGTTTTIVKQYKSDIEV
jgi:THO complex subunit 3